jgi:iron(III) transport system permease protein
MADSANSRSGARGAAVCAGLALVMLATASARLRGLFLNSALLAGGALAVALPVGTLLGVVVAKVDVPGRRLLAWLLVGLLFVPLYAYAGAWQSVLGLGGWLSMRTIDGYADPWLQGWRGALWVHGMAAVPWVALAVAAALATIERRLEEESLLDAAPWRVLVRVSLRRAAGGVAAAAAWVALMCATEITVTDLYQIRTFAEEVYADASLGMLVAPAGVDPASAIGVVAVEPFLTSDLALGVAALALLTFAAAWLMAPWLRVAAALPAEAGWMWRPTHRWLGTAAVGALVVAVVLAPLVVLAWKAGLDVEQQGEQYIRSWSPVKLLTMVGRSPWEFRREWGWSLQIGVLAAIVATAFALVTAWTVRLARRPRASALVAGVIALAAAIPAPLLGVWVIAALNRPADSAFSGLTWLYDRTLVAPIFVQAVRALPLATLWLWSQLESVPGDLLEAARSEGAGPWAQLVRVALPLRRVGVLAALTTALAVAMGELSATLLVLPPGVTTASVRVFQLLHYGVDDRVAAQCLAIFGVLGLGVGAAAAVSAARARLRRGSRPPAM